MYPAKMRWELCIYTYVYHNYINTYLCGMQCTNLSEPQTSEAYRLLLYLFFFFFSWLTQYRGAALYVGWGGGH